MLHRLFYERDKLRIYASFPITQATEEENKSITAFKERLSQRHIVFDPYKLAEKGIVLRGLSHIEILSEQITGNPKAYDLCIKFLEKLRVKIETFRDELGVPPDGSVDLHEEPNLETLLMGICDYSYEPTKVDLTLRQDKLGAQISGNEYTLPLLEINSLNSLVDGQIFSRDYKLIDQSNILCVYISWDEEEDEPKVSAGSQTEIAYGRNTGKDRFLVCKGKRRRMSPWIGRNATEIFNSVEDLEKYLQNYKAK